MDLRRTLTYRAARHLGRRSVPLQLPRAAVSFCFDDFPRSAADAGARILEERGLHGSFYACADFAGQTINGVRQFDAADLQCLEAAGHEIGCHTAGHPRVTRLSPAQIRNQIARNDRGLATLGLAGMTQTFAYPFGDVGLTAKRVLSERFVACRGVWAGLNAGIIDRALLQCVCLEAHVLARKPVEAWIEEAVARDAWLIFLTHDVAANPTDFGIEPAKLEAAVDRALTAGADVLPLETVFRRGTASASNGPAAPAPSRERAA